MRIEDFCTLQALMSEPVVPYETPPSELLERLRVAWGYPEAAPLKVVGRLRPQRKDDGRVLTFLEALEHPDDGQGLVYPLQNDRRQANAFVSPGDAKQVVDIDQALNAPPWAIAELEIAPLDQRRKHENPFECSVRRGTLRLLSDVPKDWEITVSGPSSALRIARAARDAIGEWIERDLSDLHYKTTIERTRLGELTAAVQHHEGRLRMLNEHILRETQLMEEHFRHLSDLLNRKGRRLVALDLIDEDDLKALLPQKNDEKERLGHNFRDVLGGDLNRLAPFVQARLFQRGILFSKAQLRDFIALVRTHDLIVLAGDSGSGKTSLVRAVADSVGGRCTIIPVKPNWTGPEDLLGYFNPIERKYHPTPFLLALQAAAQEPEVPHFICLDEMNLARVEHYFADFLSLLEDRSDFPEIPLYTSEEEQHAIVENRLFLAIEAEVRARTGLDESATLEDLLRSDQANQMLHQLTGLQKAESVLAHHGRLRRALAALIRTPTSLKLPPNVRIVGAVNIDETTHYLSPKVLDRVHVVRFRNPVLTNWDDLEAEVETFDLDLSVPIAMHAKDFGPREEYPPLDKNDPDTVFLIHLARDYLDPLGIEFGLRAIRQSINYIRQAESVGIDRSAALNNVVLHKILPKILLDTGRTDSSGRRKIDLLGSLRDALTARMDGLDKDTVTESCVDAIGKVIAGAEGNNGIANFWAR